MPAIISGESYESYLQKNLCGPLSMKSTTFYPFSPSPLASRIPPLRWFTEDGTPQVFEDQQDLLKLPRENKEIEYPAGGGGIYSTAEDYCKFLQHCLQLHLALSLPESEWPKDALLSRKSAATLFSRSLPESALPSLAAMLSMTARPKDINPGEADWSSAFQLYLPEDGRRWDGYGRKAGSGGWAGAAGSWYWVDPESRVCVSEGFGIFGAGLMANHDAWSALDRTVRIQYADASFFP